MTPWYVDDAVTVWHGDCLDVLADMADNSVDAVVTDPPYGLEFMGKDWDRFGGEIMPVTDTTTIGRQSSTPFAGADQRVRYGRPGVTYQQWCQTWAEHCHRVLKPGGHLLAFGGTRTHHRLACAIEDAGFEIRDSIAWLYGSGFPKSLDVGKAIDRAAGAEREIPRSWGANGEGHDPKGTLTGRTRATAWCEACGRSRGSQPGNCQCDTTGTPITDDARRWNGWGTALKPAHEPIVVARKPLAGTVAANVLAWGTGGLNIDAARINPGAAVPGGGGLKGGAASRHPGWQRQSHLDGSATEAHTAGRWPPNVALDPHTAAALDQQSGIQRDGVAVNRNRPIAGSSYDASSYNIPKRPGPDVGYGGEGGASRFFPVFRYEPKAPTLERPRADDAAAHPTVKPLDLMRWLVRLVTPPGGLVLDPFLGSGTTAEACIVEGFRCVGVEREATYLPMIRARLTKPIQPVLDLGEL